MTDGIMGHLSISINVRMSGKLFRYIFFALFAAAGCTSEPVPGGTCTTSRDCLQTEICLGGTCTPINTGGGDGCTSDLDCELGRYCNIPTGQCLDGAAPEDAGFPGQDGTTPAADGGASPNADGGTNNSADAATADGGMSTQCITDQECGPPDKSILIINASTAAVLIQHFVIPLQKFVTRTPDDVFKFLVLEIKTVAHHQRYVKAHNAYRDVTSPVAFNAQV